MVDSFTTNYGFTLPEVGASDDTWGPKLNGNWTSVDSIVAGKAPLASPVLTGDPKAPTPATADNDTSIATTAFVKAQGYLTAVPGTYAPIASPVFTGDPQAPTPAAGDNDTSIATTAFVKAQSYATVASVALKADIASPTFTGDPKAPTPSAADNDTSISTTAFVKTAIATKIDEAPSDNVQYVRKNAAWSPVSVPPGTFIGDVAPSSPSAGQLWFESDTGNTFIYYDDGNTTQWVQINVGTGTQGPISVDAPADSKYYARFNNNWVAEPAQAVPGVFKISEGTLAVAGPYIDIDLPTTGYHTLELLLVDVAVPGGAVSISFDFSYDGGATFPNGAGQYVYSQSSTTSAANGGFTATGGTTTNSWVFWSIASTVMKGFANIRMPVVVGGTAQQISRSSCYSGTAYISQDTWTSQNVITGPPNKGRLRASSGNMNAGLRWQLNGMR